MNEQERAELDWLKKRQTELLEQLGDLDRRLVAFETHLGQPEPTLTSDAPPAQAPEISSAQTIIVEDTPKPASPSSVPPVIQPSLAPIFTQIEAEAPAAKPVPSLP